MANLYDKASLLMVPSGYKAGTLYSVKPDSGSGDFTFSRASVATRWDINLELEEMAANVPRLQYPSCPSLLLEPARTNLFLNSDVGATQTITLVSGSVYTIYFLSGDGTIDLTDAHTETVNVSDYTYNNAVTFTAGSTSLVCTVIGTANQVQVELGGYPTSYIETTGLVGDRAFDAMSVDSLVTNGIITSTAATVVIDIKLPNVIRDVGVNTFQLGTANGQIYIYNASPSVAQYGRVIVQSTDATGSIVDLTQENNKLAFQVSANDVKTFLNGVEVASTLKPFSFTSELLTLSGRCRSSDVNEILLFPTTLTDAECIELTT